MSGLCEAVVSITGAGGYDACDAGGTNGEGED